MGKLLQLITKLFGKNALSKTLGTRTNVIKLPSNEKKRLIKDELNIEAASELAAQKVLKEAEDLIADIPRMNDQEILTLTGNLQRLDNKLNPPSAEVLDITTKKPITGEGLEQLAARDGLPADVSPDSPIGKVMQGAQRLRKEKEELDRMLKDPVKQLEQEMQNPYRAGGALDPKMGIVRTAARQVLQKLAREGKINIADPEEAKAIIEGYQGGVDPVEVFRKTFGEEALGDLANLGDELLEIDNRGGSFKELKKILEDEGFFNLQQPKNPTQGMTDEELMKLIKDEDPEGFATGGRVGYSDGGYTFEQFLKDKQQVDEFMSIEELKREYKRMMELKKIRDQRDMVAKGGRVGFDDGGILSLEEAQKLNPGMFVDTTTYNPIPEDAANTAADEIAKMIMSTLGMDDDMASRTFVFEEYVVPKRKELMEDFGLTMKEADDLIREGMAKYRTNKATGGRVGFQKGSPEIFDQLEMNVPYPYGHRVNYQTGGEIAYDATNPIYGSSAITVTPNTIMGPQGNQIQAQTGVNQALQRPQNPFQNIGFLDRVGYTQHMNEDRMLKDANIENQLMNRMGGLNVTQANPAFGLQNPFGPGIGITMLGGAAGAYQGIQSLAGALGLGPKQSLGEMVKDTYENTMGQTILANPEQLEMYNKALNRPTDADVAGPSRETIIQRILKEIEPGFENENSIARMYPDDYKTGLDLDYLKTLNPDEVKLALDNAYLQGENFQNPDFSTGRIGGGSPFFRYGPQYMEQFNMQGGPLQLSDQYTGYNLRNQLGELESILGKEGIKSYRTKLDDALIDLYRNNYSGDTDLQKRIFGLASGGRVGYAYGSGLKLIQILQKLGKNLKTEIKKAVDDLIPSGDPKLDADMAVDNMLEDLNIDRDTIDQYDVLDAYGMAYDELKKPLLAGLKNKPKPFPKTADDVKKEAVEKYGIKPERADEIMNTQFDEKNLDDILNDADEAYGVTPEMKKELDEMAKLTPKAAERFELKIKYPGLDDDIITAIVDDPNPKNKAQVLSTLDQLLELHRRGKSPEEAVDIIKQTMFKGRKDNAKGGLNYLSGF